MEKIIRQLTVSEVEKRVQYIKQIGDSDAEQAHSMEDALYSEFIEGISAGLYTKAKAVEVAAAILKTQDADFSRWCA